MRRALLVLIAVALTTACGGDDPTGSNSGPRLRITAGANSTDTISSMPTQGLVVEVRDATGKPAAGVEVRFESNDTGGMFVSGVAESSWHYVSGATTDANGRAAVRVLYGLRAGSAWIATSVPLYNLADTARYTIQPGAAAEVELSPKDTAITAGATFTYRGAVVDRAGNARPDAAMYEAVGTAITVSSTGKVSAVGFGNATVIARVIANGLSGVDSGTVAVVPTATIAWNHGSNQLVVSSLTGENKTTPAAVGLAPTWEPGGNRFVVSNSGLVIVGQNGNGTPLPTPGFTDSTWPEWSTDGFIYFQGATSSGRRVARIRPDGSGLEALALGVTASMPSPSPDGASIVYVAGDNIGALTILNLATGTRTILPGTQNAQSPRWSPDGQWIAYTKYSQGELMLIRPSGAELHRIGAHGLYAGISWSPDSKWILGAESRLTIVDIQTGVMAYLWSFPFDLRQPAWKRI
jgi:hypothetical protein